MKRLRCRRSARSRWRRSVLLALGAASRRRPTTGRAWRGGVVPLRLSLAFATRRRADRVARVPGNPIGWIFCAMGAVGAASATCVPVRRPGALVSPVAAGRRGGGRGCRTSACRRASACSPFALLLFPDGRLPSRRWRWVVVARARGGIAVIVVGYAFRPGPLDPPFEHVSNPLGIAGRPTSWTPLAGFGWMFMGARSALAAARSSSGSPRSTASERQQLKWLALAAAITGVAIVADVVSYFVGEDAAQQRRIAARRRLRRLPARGGRSRSSATASTTSTSSSTARSSTAR